MNKIILMTGVAISFFATSANAEGIQQYISAKFSGSQIRNKASNQFLIKNDNEVLFKGTIVDKRLTDDVTGVRFAYGISKNLTKLTGSIRNELEYGINSTAKEAGNFNFYTGNIQSPETGTYSHKMNITSIMLNTYYDYPLTENFIPYIGFGIGYSHIKNTGAVTMPISIWNTTYSQTVKDTEDNFAYNLSIGAGYKATENITIDLGYKYSNFGYVKNKNDVGSSKYNIDSHELYLGGRYSF